MRLEAGSQQKRPPENLDAGGLGQILDAHRRKIGIGRRELVPELQARHSCRCPPASAPLRSQDRHDKLVAVGPTKERAAACNAFLPKTDRSIGFARPGVFGEHAEPNAIGAGLMENGIQQRIEKCLSIPARRVADGDSYSKTIAMKRRAREAYLNRGLVYSKMGNVDEAITDFGEAIKLKPDYALALAHRSGAFVERENTSAQLPMLRKLFGLSRNSPTRTLVAVERCERRSNTTKPLRT